MPPRGVKSPKRVRQYEHVLESEKTRGVRPRRAKEIAARTVNKQRRKAGEAKSAPRRAAAGKTSRRKSTMGSSRGGASRSLSTSRRSSSGRGRSTGGSSRSRRGTSSRGKR